MFIEIIAEAYRVDEKTVALFARLLREAGMLTSGGRGRHAPHMQPIDAARMTIALLATDKPARAVERLQRFAKITLLPNEREGFYPPALGIAEGATLESVLTNLFSADMERDDPFGNSPYLQLDENTRTATIEFSNKTGMRTAFFRPEGRSEDERAQDAKELFGIRQMRGLASAELSKVYIPFYLERRAGKPWEEICADIEASRS